MEYNGPNNMLFCNALFIAFFHFGRVIKYSGFMSFNRRVLS